MSWDSVLASWMLCDTMSLMINEGSFVPHAFPFFALVAPRRSHGFPFEVVMIQSG